MNITTIVCITGLAFALPMKSEVDHCRVSSFVTISRGDTSRSQVWYDVHDRLSLIVVKYAGWNDTATFRYFQDTVVVRRTREEILFVKSKAGDSMTRLTYFPKRGAPEWRKEEFVVDRDGAITMKGVTQDGLWYDGHLTLIDGNIVREDVKTVGGGSNSVSSEYYLGDSMLNQPAMFIIDPDVVLTTKSLLKNTRSAYDSTWFCYRFNATGNVTRVDMTSKSDSTIWLIDYSCD